MDNIDLNKPFIVLSFSRAKLVDAGLTQEQNAALHDEDLEAIANQLSNAFSTGFSEELLFRVRLFLAEKGASHE
jgi:hypothetical protein